MTAQAVDLDPCLLRISGIILLGESKAKPSGTKREHEPNGCGESRYKTKRGNHLISMAYCRRVGRKVNRRGPRTMNGLLECVCRHLSA